MYFNLKLNNLISTGMFYLRWKSWQVMVTVTLFLFFFSFFQGNCDSIYPKDQIIIELQTRTRVKNILEIIFHDSKMLQTRTELHKSKHRCVWSRSIRVVLTCIMRDPLGLNNPEHIREWIYALVSMPVAKLMILERTSTLIANYHICPYCHRG